MSSQLSIHHPHSILDLSIGIVGMLMLNLHSVAQNEFTDDVFKVAGWFVIAIGVARSTIWLIRKIKQYTKHHDA